MPWKSHDETWYALDFGPVHLLALNSELNMAPGSVQWEFAAADLAAVNRSSTPFVVVQWHRLMYSAAASSNSDYQWGDKVRQAGRGLSGSLDPY